MLDRSEKRWSICGQIVLAILSFLAIAPFVLLVTSSLTDEHAAIRNGYSFFPAQWSLDAYRYVFSQWVVIGKGYVVSFFITIVGTVVGVTMAAMLAYMLSHKDLPGRRILSFLLTFTMLFNGGLTSTYIVYTQVFHVKDTIFGLLLPNLLMNAYSVMMFRNYFQYTLSESLVEAAKIDGATETKTFFKIVIPLSMPMIATVGLSSALRYWNDWTNGMYYLTTNSGLQSIQTLLNNINLNIQFLQQNMLGSREDMSDLPSTTVRMAIAMMGIIPTLCLYPFFQKWFIKGATIGAVKE